jgi:hypothetical protein
VLWVHPHRGLGATVSSTLPTTAAMQQYRSWKPHACTECAPGVRQVWAVVAVAVSPCEAKRERTNGICQGNEQARCQCNDVLSSFAALDRACTLAELESFYVCSRGALLHATQLVWPLWYWSSTSAGEASGLNSTPLCIWWYGLVCKRVLPSCDHGHHVEVINKLDTADSGGVEAIRTRNAAT